MKASKRFNIVLKTGTETPTYPQRARSILQCIGLYYWLILNHCQFVEYYPVLTSFKPSALSRFSLSQSFCQFGQGIYYTFSAIAGISTTDMFMYVVPTKKNRNTNNFNFREGTAKKLLFCICIAMHCNNCIVLQCIAVQFADWTGLNCTTLYELNCNALN